MLFRRDLLAKIVRATLVSDVSRAEALAGSIPDDAPRHEALAHIARVVAREEPDRARNLIQRIEDETPVSPAHLRALAGVARALAGADPASARAVARSALDVTGTVHTDDDSRHLPSEVFRVLAPVAPDLVVSAVRHDPSEILAFLRGATTGELDHALRIASKDRRLYHGSPEMLAEVVRLLADRDPAEAIEYLNPARRFHRQHRAWRQFLESLAVSRPDLAGYLLTGWRPGNSSRRSPCSGRGRSPSRIPRVRQRSSPSCPRRAPGPKRRPNWPRRARRKLPARPSHTLPWPTRKRTRRRSAARASPRCSARRRPLPLSRTRNPTSSAWPGSPRYSVPSTFRRSGRSPYRPAPRRCVGSPIPTSTTSSGRPRRPS